MAILKVVGVLAKTETDISKVLGKGNTPLHLAVYKGYQNIVSILIEAEVNLDAVNDCRETPLSRAA